MKYENAMSSKSISLFFVGALLRGKKISTAADKKKEYVRSVHTFTSALLPRGDVSRGCKSVGREIRGHQGRRGAVERHRTTDPRKRPVLRSQTEACGPEGQSTGEEPATDGLRKYVIGPARKTRRTNHANLPGSTGIRVGELAEGSRPRTRPREISLISGTEMPEYDLPTFPARSHHRSWKNTAGDRRLPPFFGGARTPETQFRESATEHEPFLELIFGILGIPAASSGAGFARSFFRFVSDTLHHLPSLYADSILNYTKHTHI